MGSTASNWLAMVDDVGIAREVEHDPEIAAWVRELIR